MGWLEVNRMKHKLPIVICFGLLLGAIIVGLVLSLPPEHDPRDLGYWMRAGQGRDWSSEAAQGVPQAQFQRGLSLVATNMVITISRARWLSSWPIVGKRYFDKRTYALGTGISAEKLTEAHAWIKNAADQGFQPAKEALKLFAGRMGTQSQARVVGLSGQQVLMRFSPTLHDFEPDFAKPSVPDSAPAKPGNGSALTAAQATELAEKLANDRAEAAFQCRPFYDSPPARPSSSGWIWESRCGHRLVDFEAKVTFGTDGGKADVKVVVLDSRAIDVPVQRLR